jgi:hypothetical protein
MEVSEEYIQNGIAAGTIKMCPHCNASGELASGCNYIKCPLCQKEWCWICNNPKYKPIGDGTACNDKTHNSH